MCTNDREPLFSIRSAAVHDEPYLTALFQSEGMPVLQPAQFLTGTVAVNSDDEPVGFIRIFTVNEGANCADCAGDGNYVYPVIVFKSWRQLGVASALVNHELRRRGKLKLVACRPSRGFYLRTGFLPEEWHSIANVIASDCEKCPDRASCEPQPYVKYWR